MRLRAVVGRVMRAIYRASLLGGSCGAHITRYTMYRKLEESVGPLGLSGRVLSISGSETLIDACRIVPDELVRADYPEHNIFHLPFKDGEFDVVLTDQVLEHIEGDPQLAVQECFRVLKIGGVAIHTTAFMMALHGSPGDYWRFSTSGLSYLCRQAQILWIGGWGNPLLPIVNGLGLRREPVPNFKWHPMHMIASLNRASYHHVVWIVAKKKPESVS